MTIATNGLVSVPSIAPTALAPRRLRHLIEHDGGFTLSLRSGRPVERGISVCLSPSRTMAFPLSRWDDDLVGYWLGERCLDRNWRRSSLGGWLDPRTDDVWLDAVRVVAPAFRPAAVFVGRALQQHCVFDIGRGETVALRGAA